MVAEPSVIIEKRRNRHPGLGRGIPFLEIVVENLFNLYSALYKIDQIWVLNVNN
mgnify:CR=1 FL=1